MPPKKQQWPPSICRRWLISSSFKESLSSVSPVSLAPTPIVYTRIRPVDSINRDTLTPQGVKSAVAKGDWLRRIIQDCPMKTGRGDGACPLLRRNFWHAMGIRAKIRALRTVKIPIDRLVYGPKPSNRGGRIPLMNARWMFVPAVLTTIALVAGAAEPVKNKGWTQKQFIITFWCPPPATDQTLAAVAAEHYNLTWVPVEGLDLAAKHKLRAMLTSDLLSPETLHDAAKRAELDALIAKVKRHPAMEAYFITDEPGAGAFPGLGELVAYLRKSRPNPLGVHQPFPNLRERGSARCHCRCRPAGQGRLSAKLRRCRDQR